MTKPDRTSDLLLLAGKVVTVMMQGAMVIGAAALLIALGAIAFFQDTIQADMLADPDFKGVVFPTLTMIGVMLIGLAIVATLFVFFGRLRAIINTVGEGDPFVPVNAERAEPDGMVDAGCAAAGAGRDPTGARSGRACG
jgi:hypothetical protein